MSDIDNLSPFWPPDLQYRPRYTICLSKSSNDASDRGDQVSGVRIAERVMQLELRPILCVHGQHAFECSF